MRHRRSWSFREIASEIRRECSQGGWEAGRRLRTHDELQRRFRTTRVTIQRAMDLLVQQGFVETRPKAGSFLAAQPPHLFEYALAFPGHPENVWRWQWTREFLAYQVAAEQLSAAGPWRIRPYYDLAADSPQNGCVALQADLDDQRLAGVIFAFSPHSLVSTPLLQSPTVPLVFPAAVFESGGVAVGRLGPRSILPAALELALHRGRRRPAVLTMPFTPPNSVFAELAKRPVQSLPIWTQAVSPYHPEWIRHALTTVLHGCTDQRPDVLIVTDDHAVEPVVEALASEKLSVPDELLVIGHWNFPLPYRGALPIELIGRDAEQFLRQGITWIEDQRAGRAKPGPLPMEFRRLTLSGAQPFSERMVQGLAGARAPEDGHEQAVQEASDREVLSAIEFRRRCRLNRPRSAPPGQTRSGTGAARNGALWVAKIPKKGDGPCSRRHRN